jgi:hypothetical protein
MGRRVSRLDGRRTHQWASILRTRDDVRSEVKRRHRRAIRRSLRRHTAHLELDAVGFELNEGGGLVISAGRKELVPGRLASELAAAVGRR